MSKEQYVKLDEVTEILSDVLCIPDFESRNITEEDVSKAYDKVLNLDRKTETDNKGEWIKHPTFHEDFDCWVCNKCGEEISGHENKTNFCPNCGADMRGNKKEIHEGEE